MATALNAHGNRRRLTKAQKAQKARNDSARRATKGQHTDEEKAAIRRQHRDRIAAALEALETPDGMRAFLEARELNPQLTPLAAATAALEAPGKVVMTLRQWNKTGARVRKGARAVAYATKAPAFWPDPLFEAADTDYPEEYVEAQELELEAAPVPPEIAAAAARELEERFELEGRKTKVLNQWLEAAGI